MAPCSFATLGFASTYNAWYDAATVFEEIRKAGLLRARVDGEVIDVHEPPELTPQKSHNIEVVIDRLRAKPDAKQRLAESFETALRHADGKVIVVDLDHRKETLFSSKFSCPVCDYALAELEPRLFSFNNPMGACPKCDGLGAVEFFDPRRVVAHPNLSLASGAIRGWDRRNQFYFSMLVSLAQHYGFDVENFKVHAYAEAEHGDAPRAVSLFEQVLTLRPSPNAER